MAAATTGASAGQATAPVAKSEVHPRATLPSGVPARPATWARSSSGREAVVLALGASNVAAVPEVTLRYTVRYASARGVPETDGEVVGVADGEAPEDSVAVGVGDGVAVGLAGKADASAVATAEAAVVGDSARGPAREAAEEAKADCRYDAAGVLTADLPTGAGDEAEPATLLVGSVEGETLTGEIMLEEKEAVDDVDGLAPMVSEVVGDSVTLADKELVEEVEGLLPADKRAV